MPAMITKCPGCGRNGIMSKKTGLCVHCSKGSIPAKVVPPTPKPASAPPPAAKHRPRPTSSRAIGGKVVR